MVKADTLDHIRVHAWLMLQPRKVTMMLLFILQSVRQIAYKKIHVYVCIIVFCHQRNYRKQPRFLCFMAMRVTLEPVCKHTKSVIYIYLLEFDLYSTSHVQALYQSCNINILAAEYRGFGESEVQFLSNCGNELNVGTSYMMSKLPICRANQAKKVSQAMPKCSSGIYIGEKM